MVLKVFLEWQLTRTNKDPWKEQYSFNIELEKIQMLDTNITNMNAESLNFLFTKFVQEAVKVNGEMISTKTKSLHGYCGPTAPSC